KLSSTCSRARGAMRALVNSHCSSRARARSKPSFTVDGTHAATRLARSANCMCSSTSKRRPRSCLRSAASAPRPALLSTVINSTPSMRLMRRASVLPMIQLDGAARGRGTTHFVKSAGRHFVLRHYRRGGLIAHLAADKYIWRGAENTRPFEEWQLTYRLHRAGLPVPAPLAARYRHRGLTYT